MTDPLQRASAALDEGDTTAARAALLEAWRARRSPIVAELVALLDARQPDALKTQLDEVLTPRVNTTLERFRVVSRVDDPRVSAFALDALERLPFTTPGAQPLLEAFVRVVLERRDVRLLPRAKAIREALRTRIGRAPVRDALLAELDHAVGLLKALDLSRADEALEKSLTARLAPLAAPSQSEEALLAAVYAQPRDDGPRLVYADWLLERGDPRGEFITLQFKRRQAALSDAESRREMALLKQHGKQWLGALAPVMSFGKGYARSTFERGFLSTADIILSVGKKLEPLWRADEWQTVERLEGNWPLELLERAPMRALREIDRSLTTQTLLALRKGKCELEAESIELAEEVMDWGLVRAIFPKVRSVAVWCRATPTVALLGRYAKLGLHRLELRRAWNAPRGDEVEAEFEALLGELRSTPLEFRELALMAAWQGEFVRPGVVELRATENGFSPSA